MRTHSVFSLALVAFATTILTAPITFSEDVKATIVAVGQDFDQLTAREVGGLVALAAGAESSHQGADASSLLGELPAGHTETLPAGHDKRDDTAASILAALPAGHDKRVETAASLLALLPAGHGKRDDAAAALPAGHDKRQNVASSLLAALPAGHGSE
ncbi:hypothetical protein BGZ57DRAFT_1016030 [Hyaloscypha finlandica]|nr:hypothetical protein BGZ57DRAFT_1016030 [Hyaloscypha finlandica]